MKKHTTLRALAGLLVVLALVFTAGATSAFVGAKPFYLDAPLRFDYIPKGAGDKPILATDLDGNYVKSVAHANQAITVTLQDGQNEQRTLSIPVGATLTGASYSTDTETLTLTLSESEPVTADLSGLTTSSEVATAISAAIAAETDAVLTGASYAADTENLTLNLSEGSPVTADLSGLTTAAELSSAINTALDGVSGVTVTGASYAASTETLTLTLSEGGPVTADLSGLTTSSEVATAISTALAAETDAVLTGATYAADTENLTLNLSEGSPVTTDLSGLTTAAELSSAINTALDGVSGVTVTGASYAAGTETLTLTLSEGGPVTADLSGLTTSSEVATAISTALAAETDAVLTGASYAADTENLTLNLSEGSPVTADLSGLTTAAELSSAINTALDGVSGVTVTGASYAAGTELLTLTLSEGGPVTADLSGLTTSSEVATAISTALAAETDAVLTGASYAADTENLTLNLSEGSPVTADLSGLTTAAELSTAINTALDGVSGVTVTGASYAAGTETLTLTLSEGGPVTADLSGLTTSSEVATAISTALAAETDAVLTGASYAADTENLTLNLTEGSPVTADLSGLTTAAELSTAINTALDGVSGVTVTGASYAAGTETLTLTLSEGGPVTADLSGLTTSSEVATAISTALAAETDAVLTGATYAADTETLTLTLSDGGPVTADLSDLSTDAELDTAFANGTALPQLLGSIKPSGSACTRFAPTDIIIPQSGWVAVMVGLRSNNGHHIHHYSMPVSLLHNLPVKINDTAGSATVVHTTETANALTLPVRGNGELYYIGLTTANRLVAGASNLYWPCALTVYTGPAVVAQSTATVTGASFSSTNQALTLTLSEGGSVTADLSGLTSIAEVTTTINAALAAETDAVVTAGSYTSDTENLTLTLSEGNPVSVNLGDLITADELHDAIAAIPAGGVTSASYAADTETLTLTLANNNTVTVILSGYSTATEVTTAISAALAAETDAVATTAIYTDSDETLTLTLSEGSPVTADFSDLSTDAELNTAFANATANPRLLGSYETNGEACRTFTPTTIVIPQSGWIVITVELFNNDGRYVQQLSMPVSMLHNLPVKIDDSALTATAVSTSETTANALSVPVRYGSARHYLGLTTANRLVTGTTWRYYPCRVTVYTGPAVVAQSTATVTGASFAPATQVLTLTLSEGSPVTADLSNLTTNSEVTAAISAALAAETDATLTGASYAANTKTLTLTLSDGGPVTADLSSVATTEEVTAAITAALADATGTTTSAGVTSITALTSANIPDDATEAAGLSVTEGDVTTSIKLPSLTHNVSTYTRASADRPNCQQMAVSGPPIPDEPFFFVITTRTRSLGGRSTDSHFILRSEIMAIPVALTGAANNLVNIDGTGSDRNVLSRSGDPGIHLARTASNQLAWKLSSSAASCSFQIVTLTD